MSNVFVRYVNLPWFIRGQVMLDADGDYNIYINAKYPVEMCRDALLHELKHIGNNDFYYLRPIEEVEIV